MLSPEKLREGSGQPTYPQEAEDGVGPAHVPPKKLRMGSGQPRYCRTGQGVSGGHLSMGLATGSQSRDQQREPER